MSVGWHEPWMAWVRKGDILKTPSGDFRAVRQVKRCAPRYAGHRPKIYLTFVIRHCSWTTRCTTIKMNSDLRGWVWTGLRLSEQKERDKQIEHCIVNHQKEHQVLKCCDVKDDI